MKLTLELSSFKSAWDSNQWHWPDGECWLNVDSMTRMELFPRRRKSGAFFWLEEKKKVWVNKQKNKQTEEQKNKPVANSTNNSGLCNYRKVTIDLVFYSGTCSSMRGTFNQVLTMAGKGRNLWAANNFQCPNYLDYQNYCVISKELAYIMPNYRNYWAIW